ncbi:hypothetical protein BX666DRAFT_1861888 [Dichotomocladium elegans]|nr:hypothetical protein BX666DRAFT_1861888 [Dichotomocladium elegans]
MPSLRRYRGLLIATLLTILICVANPVDAIYESQAGVFDWHHAWVGKAKWSSLTDSSRVVIGTERNVLASLNTDTGDIVWRQAFEVPVKEYHSTGTGILVLAPGNARFFDSINGRMLWEYAVGEEPRGIALSNGKVIIADSQQVIQLQDGKIQWTRKLENTSLERLHENGGAVFLISRPATQDGLLVTALDLEDGELIPESNHKLPTKAMIDNLSTVGKYLIWTEKDQLKWNLLGSKKVNKNSVASVIGSLPSFAKMEPQTIRLETVSDVVFVNAFSFEDDNFATATAIFRVEESGISLVEELGTQKTVGVVDALDGTVAQFTQLSEQELGIRLLSEERTRIINHHFNLSGDVVLAKLVNLNPIKALVVTASGSTFMYDGSSDKLLWSREEAMAHTTASEFLDLPEKQMWTQMADEISEEHPETISPFTRYLHRLQAHITELRQLPQWVIQRVAGEVAALQSRTEKVRREPGKLLDAQQCWLSESSPQVIYRDSFGLHKVLLSVTSTGKIIAQSSADRGKIIWSRYVEGVRFSHVEIVRSVSVKMPPLMVVIGESGSPHLGYEETHIYRLNALTGEDYISTIPEASQYFEPRIFTESKIAKVMRLPIEEPDEHTHILAFYESGTSRVYIYPDTEAARMRFLQFTKSFYFVQPTTKTQGFKGYQVVEGYRGSLSAKPMWTFDIPGGEQLVAVSERQPYERVALIGRVLGNRNVMYKYLNPHMFAVLTANAEQQNLKVRLVDGVKGTILYETIHRNVDASQNPVHVVQAEHWVVYHFWSTDNRARGYQTVVLELFEGEMENERVQSANFSSYDPIRPYVHSKAFMFPYSVRAMGVTTTRSGVSTREILFGLGTHQIFGVNKGFFDPRRPMEKPTKEEQEEGLIPYAPIPDERKMFLTYDLEVLGIDHILTSPALLESTSLVFSYGLDTYFTQSSPSRQFDVLSEDFSKSQLVLTIIGLVAAISITGPMVRRKRVNALWK